MEATGLGDKILPRWNVRKASLVHDVSITAWALAISPEIREDLKKRLSGDDRNAIEEYITSITSPVFLPTTVTVTFLPRLTPSATSLIIGRRRLDLLQMLPDSKLLMHLLGDLPAGTTSTQNHSLRY
jgi:hypothetical protein